MHSLYFDKKNQWDLFRYKNVNENKSELVQGFVPTRQNINYLNQMMPRFTDPYMSSLGLIDLTH